MICFGDNNVHKRKVYLLKCDKCVDEI